jgi:hypothetical protein
VSCLDQNIFNPPTPSTRSSLPDAPYLRFGAVVQSLVLTSPCPPYRPSASFNRRRGKAGFPACGTRLELEGDQFAARNPTYTGLCPVAAYRARPHFSPDRLNRDSFPSIVLLATPRPEHRYRTFNLSSKHRMSLPR